MKKYLVVFCLSLITLSAVAQRPKVGDKAPEMNYMSPKGKMISLVKSNKNKIVLIDFWASWCGPCRRSNPALVKLYNDYKSKKFVGAKKGFTVYSVSLDQDSAAWVKAIADDKLDWTTHVSDLKGWSSAAGRQYGVNSIPQCFLIDATGTIIGAYQTAEQAEADLKKLLK